MITTGGTVQHDVGHSKHHKSFFSSIFSFLTGSPPASWRPTRTNLALCNWKNKNTAGCCSSLPDQTSVSVSYTYSLSLFVQQILERNPRWFSPHMFHLCQRWLICGLLHITPSPPLRRHCKSLPHRPQTASKLSALQVDRLKGAQVGELQQRWHTNVSLYPRLTFSQMSQMLSLVTETHMTAFTFCFEWVMSPN